MTVVSFPAVETARDLERLQAKFGYAAAEIGDFVAVCMVEWPREAWSLFPVSRVTESGRVDRVVVESGALVPIDLLKFQFPLIVLRASWVRDPSEVTAMCWRVWPTLRALKKTLRPLIRQPANDLGGQLND